MVTSCVKCTPAGAEEGFLMPHLVGHDFESSPPHESPALAQDSISRSRLRSQDEYRPDPLINGNVADMRNEPTGSC